MFYRTLFYNVTVHLLSHIWVYFRSISFDNKMPTIHVHTLTIIYFSIGYPLKYRLYLLLPIENALKNLTPYSLAFIAINPCGVYYRPVVSVICFVMLYKVLTLLCVMVMDYKYKPNNCFF